MGNTLTLHKTALIEAFNLKAAIEYLLKNQDAAREALTDMPPRSEIMMMMMMIMMIIMMIMMMMTDMPPRYEMMMMMMIMIMMMMTDLPPRSENELDAVTLHNQALMNMELKPTDGFGKLQFLLQQNPFPPETFGNLLLLYCKVSCH